MNRQIVDRLKELILQGSDYDTLLGMLLEKQKMTAEDAKAHLRVAFDEHTINSSAFKRRAMIMVNMGIPVIPIPAGEKGAKLPEWEKKATTNPEQIDKWAAEDPNYNCGAVAQAKTGGVCFFEVDSAAVLEQIVKETGHTIPETFRVRSSPGKGHFYFHHTAASILCGNIPQMYGAWSFRADNQYVVGPESFKIKTNSFYERLGESQIADCPDWLIDWFVSQKKKSVNSAGKATADIPKDAAGLIPHGFIHSYLLTQAGRLRNQGLSADIIEIALLELVHKNCAPPIDTDKVKAMAQSIGKYPAGQQTDILFKKQKAGALELADEKLPYAEDDKFSESSIPPFDRSVIKGFYKECVDVLTRGTTMEPQFIFAIAKAIVGAKMAGNVRFDDLDVQPLQDLTMTGPTGSGKGEAWRRFLKILTAKLAAGMTMSSGHKLSCSAQLKILNSTDSGAGLKDAFFEPPEIQPIVCYIDEVMSLGHKASSKKNPEIIDVMGELADSTSITRSKAKTAQSRASSKTSNTAYLTVVMCGQNAEVFSSAFAGRTDVGLFDRFVCEYGSPQESGDLPPISDLDATMLLVGLTGLGYGKETSAGPGFVMMTTSSEAKQCLESFWASQDSETRRRNRLKKHLRLDAYLMAFGRGSMVVQLEDMQDALKNFPRQMAIRRVMFRGEAPDKVGYFLSLFKNMTQWMADKLAEGCHEAVVARSRNDYYRVTNASRDNEDVAFKKAWDTYYHFNLRPVTVKKFNGHEYDKYLPALHD